MDATILFFLAVLFSVARATIRVYEHGAKHEIDHHCPGCRKKTPD